MAESVGTNTSFDLSVDELIEIALEGIGGDHIGNKEARLARTSLNLVFIDLQNRGMAPLASMELTELTLAAGSSLSYPLGSDVFNILDAVIAVSASSNSNDLPLERISYTQWLEIPTKDSVGRPTQFMVDRQRNNIQLNFWPIPDNGTYTFKSWTLKKVADVDKSYQLIDLPHRYLPAIVKGLRYYMADLRGIPLEERSWFKQEYYETLQNALDEDRERIDFCVFPYIKRVLT